MTDCLFCKIIAGEIPSAKVYEDDAVLAFLDIHPVKAGHTLVVPKNHGDNLQGSSDADVARLMSAVRRVAPVVQSTVGADGYNVITNSGPAAGQTVFHTHFHIIPRYIDDGLVTWPHEGATQDQLEVLGEKLRGNLPKDAPAVCGSQGCCV